MKSLIVAALMAFSSMAGLTYAQAIPQREGALSNAPRRLRLADQLREKDREGQRTTCALPDGSTHPLNTVVSYEGQTYRCVEVFAPTPAPLVPPGQNQSLTVHIAGWVKG
jgi:hypothetical protein